MTESVRGLQAWRLSAAIAIAWLVHDAAQDVDAIAKERKNALTLARQALPATADLKWNDQALVARAPDGQLTATGLCTQPAAQDIVGYTGTTEVLLLFGARDGRIGHVEIVSSGDTKDHVRAVVEDEGLLPGYLGLTAGQAVARRPDAVSGATLTSYAIIESIALRLGGARPALRFPEPVTVVEVREELPAVTAVEDDPSRPQSGTVYRDGLPVASYLCTGSIAEGMLGYQGPSDVLLLFDVEGRVQRGVLRGTYDNQPYVRDVAIDEAFWAQFVGKTRGEVASLELRSIDGVSGATMTSHAVGRGVVAAMRDSEGAAAAERPTSSPVGLGSALVVLLLTVGALTGGHRWPVWRWGARILAIGWLGLIAGDLVSQALLVGWLQGAVPWQTAPGLVLLVAAASLVPAATGRPLCWAHLCPQGAAQLVLSRVTPRRWQYRGALRRLRWLPVILLFAVFLAAFGVLPLEPAWLEAFDGWMPTIAAWPPIVLLALSLLTAPFVPMGYCRVACPTGLLLGFLRRPATGASYGRADVAALVLLCLAVGLRLG